MRKFFCLALFLAIGCDEPKTAQPKPAAAASLIGKAVIVKPGKESITPGRVTVAPPKITDEFWRSYEVEAFRGVILDELPEEYFEGKLDDHARWLVKVEDGQFAGKTVAVYKHRVDLIPLK